jgi:lipopolysaccharide export system ATP-binding protein
LKKKNIGVLITDHNYREMLDTCDYSYVLHGGAIIAEGSKAQILDNATLKMRSVMCVSYCLHD